MNNSVAVLGGGVGGMSAAQELAERGFAVTLVEARDVPGGKARSVPVPGSGTAGRMNLPAEHGFRFFPGFYRHLPDSMSRIPYGDQRRGVLDNLREASEAEIAQVGGLAPIKIPAHFPNSVHDLELVLHDILHPITALSIGDFGYLAGRLLVLLSSCEERRYKEWDRLSWWEFSGASRRSPAYQKFMADGLTRTLVAAQAREMSARTGGYTLLQLLFDLGTPGRVADRVLDGPSSDVWIDPWLPHLHALGVSSQFGVKLEAIETADRRVTGVVVSDQRGRRRIEADWYVAAVPVEHMVQLADDAIKVADPRFAELSRLVTRWMNGIVFYLRRDVPLVRGHAIYIDSPWSLTSISQRQFWANVDFSHMGSGDVGGILSVDVSDWQAPGLLSGKTAMECTWDEIAAEVLAQLRAHLDKSNPARVSRRQHRLMVPRPGCSFPRGAQGARCADRHQPRAAARQHGRIMAASPGGGDLSWQSLLGRRLCEDVHRPSHDGGRQRGGPSRDKRNTRRLRVGSSEVPTLAPSRTRDLRTGAQARPMAL